MNSVETKMVEMVFQYNDKLKNSNNSLRLQIDKLKYKIEELEKSINNPDKRIEGMQKKLDYYEKYFTDSLIWIKPGEKEPENEKYYLCKVLLSPFKIGKYYILKYDSYNKNWVESPLAFRADEIYEYSELPKI